MTVSTIKTLTSTGSQSQQYTMIEVCSIDDLIINSGVCALVAGQQVAIFAIRKPRSIRKHEDDIDIYAVGNYDPIGKANVLYRGLLCSIEGEAMICSPLYKQHFSLVTGQCKEQEDVSVAVYELELLDKKVFVKSIKQQETSANTQNNRDILAAV